MGTVVTVCTKKKAGYAQAVASSLTAGDIHTLGYQWLATLNNAPKRYRAASLYQGASHAESRRAAHESGYSHFIASAGLGLISADAEVPHYAATILAGSDDILAKLDGEASAPHWWQWLQGRSPFAQPLSSIMKKTDGLCLVALPKAYLVMIEAELHALPIALLQRVRLFSGSPAPAAFAHLQMPYDDRLDGPDSPYPGTKSNFPARAMRHFANRILPLLETGSPAEHRVAVLDSIAQWHRPTRTMGSRRTDAELRAILAKHWDATGGRSTRMLRLLRDDLGIACEQHRFAGLVQALRTERRGLA